MESLPASISSSLLFKTTSHKRSAKIKSSQETSAAWAPQSKAMERMRQQYLTRGEAVESKRCEAKLKLFKTLSMPPWCSYIFRTCFCAARSLACQISELWIDGIKAPGPKRRCHCRSKLGKACRGSFEAIRTWCAASKLMYARFGHLPSEANTFPHFPTDGPWSDAKWRIRPCSDVKASSSNTPSGSWHARFKSSWILCSICCPLSLSWLSRVFSATSWPKRKTPSKPSTARGFDSHHSSKVAGAASSLDCGLWTENCWLWATNLAAGKSQRYLITR